MISPLRYPGGKAKLFRYFAALIHQNELFERTYAEPYAGGAGLALRLLAHGYISRIELNDIDPAIHSFWKSVLEQPEQLSKLVRDTPITVEQWKRQRATYRHGYEGDHLELGFATLFLNRTSRSGILDGSGPIGGYGQGGLWKIDARYDAQKLIDQIECLQTYKEAITVFNEDALEFAKDRISSPTQFTYLDPPYYVKGRKLYKNAYRHKDHEGIAKFLAQHRSGTWVVSYDNAPEIRALYGSFKSAVYSLQYSAGAASSGVEVMFASDTLSLPEPVSLKRAA
jgi:DNA adenine methylase